MFFRNHRNSKHIFCRYNGLNLISLAKKNITYDCYAQKYIKQNPYDNLFIRSNNRSLIYESFFSSKQCCLLWSARTKLLFENQKRQKMTIYLGIFYLPKKILTVKKFKVKIKIKIKMRDSYLQDWLFDLMKKLLIIKKFHVIFSGDCCNWSDTFINWRLFCQYPIDIGNWKHHNWLFINKQLLPRCQL